MSFMTFEQGDRILLFNKGKFREFPSKKKPLIALYRFFEFPTKLNHAVFIGSGLIFGLILSLICDFGNIKLTVFLTILSVLISIIALYFTAIAITDTFVKNEETDSFIVDDSFRQTIDAFTIEEVFEYYDYGVKKDKLRNELNYATKLLDSTSTDLPVYEDLINKKEQIEKDYKAVQSASGYLLDKIAVNMSVKNKAEAAEQKSKKEKEVLEFLNAG